MAETLLQEYIYKGNESIGDVGPSVVRGGGCVSTGNVISTFFL